MTEIVDNMLDMIGQSLPSFIAKKDSLREEIIGACHKVMEVSRNYITKLFSRFIENNLLKKVYQTQSNVVNLICDTITDSIINQMDLCDNTANNLITLSKTTPNLSENSLKNSNSTSYDNPLMRKSDSAKTEMRISRLSRFATAKARPLSKALKSIECSDTQIEELPRESIQKPKVPPITIKPNANILNHEEGLLDVTTPKSSSPRPVAPTRLKHTFATKERDNVTIGDDRSLTKNEVNKLETSTHGNNYTLSSPKSPNSPKSLIDRVDTEIPFTRQYSNKVNVPEADSMENQSSLSMNQDTIIKKSVINNSVDLHKEGPYDDNTKLVTVTNNTGTKDLKSDKNFDKGKRIKRTEFQIKPISSKVMENVCSSDSDIG